MFPLNLVRLVQPRFGLTKVHQFKPVSCFSFSSSSSSASPQDSPDTIHHSPHQREPHSSPYRNLFPWKNELELAKLLAENVVSWESGLIAISKPFGLAMYRNAERTQVRHSKMEQLISSGIVGSPRYCLTDVLDLLAQLLGVDKLQIVKSSHRDWSGLVLLSTSDKITPFIEKSVRRSKASLIPYMKFYCITSGIMTTSKGTERCGIRLFELDEFGDYKEPIYVPPEKLTGKMKKNSSKSRNMFKEGSTKPVNVHYRTLATNTDLAVSLVELQTSVTKWSLAQCFLAYKASFVLGDTFFSQRVKHLLGQPMAILPKKVKTVAEIRNMDHGAEPLSLKVQRTLGVTRNSQLPLMVHCAGLTFPGLAKSTRSLKLHRPEAISSTGTEANKQQVEQNELVTKSDDLIISCDQYHQMPPHFTYTLERLKLDIFTDAQLKCNNKAD